MSLPTKYSVPRYFECIHVPFGLPYIDSLFVLLLCLTARSAGWPDFTTRPLDYLTFLNAKDYDHLAPPAVHSKRRVCGSKDGIGLVNSSILSITLSTIETSCISEANMRRQTNFLFGLSYNALICHWHNHLYSNNCHAVTVVLIIATHI